MYFVTFTFVWFFFFSGTRQNGRIFSIRTLKHVYFSSSSNRQMSSSNSVEQNMLIFQTWDFSRSTDDDIDRIILVHIPGNFRIIVASSCIYIYLYSPLELARNARMVERALDSRWMLVVSLWRMNRYLFVAIWSELTGARSSWNKYNRIRVVFDLCALSSLGQRTNEWTKK